MLSWLDDIVLQSSTTDGLFEFIGSFFVVCDDNNIKLHPARCIIFATEIRCCGRILFSNGLRYDPRRMDGLLSMQPPTTGSHLQQFVCALQWVKQGIPNFTRLVSPLHEFLELVYDHAGKRAKRGVTVVLLANFGRYKTEMDFFDF